MSQSMVAAVSRCSSDPASTRRLALAVEPITGAAEEIKLPRPDAGQRTHFATQPLFQLRRHWAMARLAMQAPTVAEEGHEQKPPGAAQRQTAGMQAPQPRHRSGGLQIPVCQMYDISIGMAADEHQLRDVRGRRQFKRSHHLGKKSNAKPFPAPAVLVSIPR